MTITRQQVDAWDAEVNAAYERGRQEGMKQERALWTLTKVGQEIEAQPVQEPTLQEQLANAEAKQDKAKADWRKANDEVARIQTIIKEQKND